MMVNLTGISVKEHSWDLFLAKCILVFETQGSFQRELYFAKRLICMSFPPSQAPQQLSPLLGSRTHDFLDQLIEFLEQKALAVAIILAVAEARKHITVNGSHFNHAHRVCLIYIILYHTPTCQQDCTQLPCSAKVLRLNIGYIANQYTFFYKYCFLFLNLFFSVIFVDFTGFNNKVE